VDHRPRETSPAPSPAFTTSRPPHAGEFFGATFSGSSHLPWPSPSLTGWALPCSPSGANLSTLQACPEIVEGIHFMSRAAVLPSFLRRTQRFSTSGRPEALVACYATSWQDFHRLADDSFQDTPATGWAATLVCLEGIVICSPLFPPEFPFKNSFQIEQRLDVMTAKEKLVIWCNVRR
jgi:hypothetical protein